MILTIWNEHQGFRRSRSFKVTIDGDTRTLGAWVDEFNEIRRSFNGPDYKDCSTQDITRGDLALEFANEAYNDWDMSGHLKV